MDKQKTSLQEIDEKAERKRNNPDKRDSAEKSSTVEVLKDLTTVIPGEMHESPKDEGKTTRHRHSFDDLKKKVK